MADWRGCSLVLNCRRVLTPWAPFFSYKTVQILPWSYVLGPFLGEKSLLNFLCKCLSWMWRPALITIAISILCCFFFLCCFPASDVSLNVRNHKTEKITKPKNVVCTQSIGNGFLFPYEEVKIKQKFWSVSQSCMESSVNGREGNNFYKWV